MTPEAKIWTILNKIDDALTIAPSDEPASVDIKELEKSIPRGEHEQIFTKLAKDSQLFEIQTRPDYKANFRYKVMITDAEKFRRALNDAHIRHFGSLEMLTGDNSGDNFFAVVDVSADIMNELQMTTKSEVRIPIIPSFVRFTTLLPVKSVNLINRYWDFRWKALQYLKNNEAIMSFQLHRDEIYRLESTVGIGLDRIKFTKFYERLMNVYKKRVKFPNKEEENKTAATIPQPPTQRVEIVGGKMEVEGLRDGLTVIAQFKKEDSKQKFSYKLPAGTKWEEITIKFEDDERVFIQAKQFKLYTNYREMGFVGKGNNPNPSKAWIFLKVLAQVNGELAIKDTQARDKYKKQKELLAKSLQSYFSLDYDPFYPYCSSSEKQGNSYKIKITLIPPPADNKKPVAAEEDDDLGVKEYLKEQAPQVNEE